MLGLYLAGFVGAMTTAWLLKSSILKSSETPFILELPQYRMPTLRSLALRLVDRARIFLRQAGTIILCVTLALWVLAHLPVIQAASGSDLRAGAGRQRDRPPGPLHRAGHCAAGLQLEDRHRPALERAGPRGDGQHHGHALRRRPGTQACSLQTALHHDMTLGGALALMIFFAFAMQCTSTMAVVRRETNSWKWPAVQFLYMLALAWARPSRLVERESDGMLNRSVGRTGVPVPMTSSALASSGPTGSPAASDVPCPCGVRLFEATLGQSAFEESVQGPSS
jgi:ferrous iron transport protein B